MSTNLVIVESPTKARTLTKFLGNKYRIEASMGHIRDLPKAELGVDTEDNFAPRYVIPRDKKKKVNELKKLAADAKVVYLATDPDREGEAIAWHLQHILTVDDRKLKVGVEDRRSKIEKKSNSQSSTIKKPSSIIHRPSSIQRVEFHEITEEAIKAAFEHPREIDLELVDAQQARRVLDRLVGYKLSPILWKKVKRGLSAGRVQTVALRLIVEREREIQKFVALEYWSVDVEVSTSNSQLASSNVEASSQKPEARFLITLAEVNGQKLDIKGDKGFFIHNKEEADGHVANLEKASYKVSKVTQREVRRYPAAPFTTSTLQQTAGNRLGFTAKRTMMVAQNLYEQGFITYMRTDSVNLSVQAISQARDYIKQRFGNSYLPASPRVYKSKSKNAQEAHEAIRPTNVKLVPDKLAGDGFSKDHKRLYDLIWSRTVASQMSEAVMDQTTVEVNANPLSVIPGSDSSSEVLTKEEATPESRLANVPQVDSGQAGMTGGADTYLLKATGSVLKFDGWLKLFGIKTEEEEKKKDEDQTEEEKEKNQLLPPLTEGEDLNKEQVLPLQHFTQPPPRYSEASLIKKLEELGIGRPSTYAPTLSTIQDRFYVERVERRFVPTVLGFTVTDFLIRYFPDVFDYTFTATMEDQLDEISRGERKWKETIKTFYDPLEGKIDKTMEEAEKVDLPVETVDQVCPECGKQLIVKTGRFGKFLACSGFPDCKHTESFDQKLDIKCPKDGGDVVLRKTKKGRPFYGCKNYPKCDFASWTKPKSSE